MLKYNIFKVLAILVFCGLLYLMYYKFSYIQNSKSLEKEKESDLEHIALEIKPNERCIVIAPHPDDESLGCGGLLIKYAKQCDVVVLTDGRFGDHEISEEEEIALRRQELKAAMEFIGVHSYKQLDIRDTKVKYNLHRLNELNLRDYDYVFVPNKYEAHTDHAPIYNKVKKILFLSKTKLVSYEVWSTLPDANYFLDITDIMDKKIELINIYKSQMKYIDYINGIRGLNAYRGMITYKKYAEGFRIE